MMPRSITRLSVTALGCILVSIPAHLTGQENRHGELKRPTIGSHTFLLSDADQGPFLGSYLRQSLGVAKAVGLEFPLGIIGDDTLVVLDGDLAFAVLDFEYQAGVKDWLAARGRFKVLSRLGTNGMSLLAEGLQVNTGFEFGWLLRLLRTDRVLLSLNADVSRRSFTVIDVKGFVQDVVDGVDDARLADNIPAVRGVGGIRVAWGISPLFGVGAVLGAGYGDAVRRNDAGDFIYTTGATLDFDLGTVTPVPLGISLSYTQSSAQEQLGLASDVRTGVLRVGYAGRPDFTFAVDVIANVVRDASLEQRIETLGVQLATRYYF